MPGCILLLPLDIADVAAIGRATARFDRRRGGRHVDLLGDDLLLGGGRKLLTAAAAAVENINHCSAIVITTTNGAGGGI